MARVTVRDTIPPVVSCKDTTLSIGKDGVLLLTPVVIHRSGYDNCGVPSLTISKTYFTCDDIGANKVILYATDKYGNMDSCTATVTITGALPPNAADDAATVVQNNPMLVFVLMNDTDPYGKVDKTSVRVTRRPLHGTAIADTVFGAITYIPDKDYLGNDVFTYRICGDTVVCGASCDTAVVRMKVIAENKPPVAFNDLMHVGCWPLSENILSNDSDPDGGQISLTPAPIQEPLHGSAIMVRNGILTYTPSGNYHGPDSLKYEICDDGFPVKCDTATVMIDIFPDENCDGIPDIPDCVLFVPEGFSPNGDGIHDYFEVACIDKYPNATMTIYNRWGNKLFEKSNYGNLSVWGAPANAWWDGYSDSKLTVGHEKVPAGNYIYMLNLGDGTVIKGTVMVSY